MISDAFTQTQVIESLAQTIGAKESELKSMAEKMGKNPDQKDLLKFQSKMNLYTQTLQLVSTVQAEHAKAVKEIIQSIR